MVRFWNDPSPFPKSGLNRLLVASLSVDEFLLGDAEKSCDLSADAASADAAADNFIFFGEDMFAGVVSLLLDLSIPMRS